MKLPIWKEKQVSLKIDKQLFQRFLVLSKSRDINLQYVLSHELSPIPLSICYLSGDIRKTQKSTLLKELIDGTSTDTLLTSAHAS